jgi:limonene-1,2-epoxide hydrolase
VDVEQIARAFSGHRFEEAFPHLADDVRWVLIGASTLHGKRAVIEACRQTEAGLSGVSAEFSRFVVIAGDGTTAAVDVVGVYTDAQGQRSVVASCDIYELADAKVSTITSYTVELAPGAGD